MNPSPSSPGASALPPLPDFQGGGGAAGESNPMASILTGVMPVKTGVDSIRAACAQIVQSGVIPGAEQVCGQIMALATSLLPMAFQAAMGPGQSQAPPQGGQPGNIPPPGASGLPGIGL